jgi:hypothetical protein
MKWATILAFAGSLYAQRLADLAVPKPLPAGSTLVIGFLGGFERWDDEHRSVRRLALDLRRIPGIYAESIANRNRRVALDLIREALDRNRNHRLEPDDLSHARVILYGQSWGGAAAVETARDLNRLGVPVLLIVQVDSVGHQDEVIPSNVLTAVNFFQHDPFTIWGRREIRAADPVKTEILGNFDNSYMGCPLDKTGDASWLRCNFGGSHAKMELDPAVWGQVKQYIKDAISSR